MARSNRSGSRIALIGLLGLFVLSSATVCPAQLVITPAHATGVYKIGENVSWRIELRQSGQQPTDIKYTLKRNQIGLIKDGSLDFAAGPADISTTADQAGQVFLEINSTVNGRKIRTLAGALVSPETLQPSSPRPADFDEFWAGKIKLLADIPANPQVEPVDSGKANIDYFKIRLDNINNTHVYGQLARPGNAGKYPALLILQWAGVYALQKNTVVNRAGQGWLTLNIEPHDIPFDQPADFYTKASQTTLKDYYLMGNDDREKSYFLRMYLSAYQAAEYLTHREDWDGKTLVVMGTSMGGQQTVILAGLHPKVTAMMANVPSSCDMTGPTIGRAAAFPDWASSARRTGNKKILETGQYFDPVNFASGIKCPAMVAMGLIDETCPAAGVYSAFNQITSPKEVVVMVNSDHQGKGNTQAPFNNRAEQWLKALAAGESPIKEESPIKQN